MKDFGITLYPCPKCVRFHSDPRECSGKVSFKINKKRNRKRKTGGREK